MFRRCCQQVVKKLYAQYATLLPIFLINSACGNFTAHINGDVMYHLQELDGKVGHLSNQMHELNKDLQIFMKEMDSEEELFGEEYFRNLCANRDNAIEELKQILESSMNQKNYQFVSDINKSVESCNPVKMENMLLYIVQLLHKLGYKNVYNLAMNVARNVVNKNKRFLVYKEIYKQMCVSKEDDVYRTITLLKRIQQEILKEGQITECTKRDALKFENGMKLDLKDIGKRALKSRYLHYHFGGDKANDLILQAILEEGRILFQHVMREFLSELYNVNGVGANKLLSFVNNSSFVDQRVFGLSDVLLLVKSNNDNDVVINLANIAKEIKENHYSNLSAFGKILIGDIIRNLPESVRNLVFADKICIKQVHWDDYLYIGPKASNGERYVLFRIAGTKPDGSEWRALLYEGDVYAFNNVRYKNEYISVSSVVESNTLLDVFTGHQKNVGSAWQIIPDGDYCYFRNLYSNSYLGNFNDTKFNSVSSYSNVLRDNHNLIKHKRCLWIIEDCS